MANSDNLIHFLSSTGQLCERHDMEHYHQLQNSKCDILNKKILVREVKKIWVGLTPVYIQSLYSSISRRIRSVIVAKGHITKY
jgi:hypothetical protein